MIILHLVTLDDGSLQGKGCQKQRRPVGQKSRSATQRSIHRLSSQELAEINSLCNKTAQIVSSAFFFFFFMVKDLHLMQFCGKVLQAKQIPQLWPKCQASTDKGMLLSASSMARLSPNP